MKNEFDEALREQFERVQLKIQKRQSSNLEIVNLLSKVVERHPELRFTQILSALGLDKDRFYEESVDTLQDIKNRLENMGE